MAPRRPGNEPRARTPARPAFTLVEALVAITITAMAGSVMMLGTTVSLQTTTDSLRQTIAAGMAEQLMDEIVGCRYAAVGAGGLQVDLGPSVSENHGPGRSPYDDIDDFDGFRARPPQDPWGIALGTDDGEGGRRHEAFRAPTGFFENWQQAVDVYYVDPTDWTVRLGAGRTSDYRAVEVRIFYNDPQRGSRELAHLRRIVAYVPEL